MPDPVIDGAGELEGRLRAAWDEGILTALVNSGVSLDQCPYSDVAERAAWRGGTWHGLCRLIQYELGRLDPVMRSRVEAAIKRAKNHTPPVGTKAPKP